jgi:uncharacterized protein YndB with AHSA1/START domain
MVEPQPGAGLPPGLVIALADGWTMVRVRRRRTTRDPPNRLAFTWLWDHNPTRTLIELEMEETDGITTVRFTHTGLWDEAAVRSHKGGWDRSFDNLARTLETTS